MSQLDRLTSGPFIVNQQRHFKIKIPKCRIGLFSNQYLWTLHKYSPWFNYFPNLFGNGFISNIYLLNFFFNNETLKEKDYRWEFYCLLLHLIMMTRNIFMVFIASCHKDCSFFYSFHGVEEDWSCKSCLLKKG